MSDANEDSAMQWLLSVQVQAAPSHVHLYECVRVCACVCPTSKPCFSKGVTAASTHASVSLFR